MKKILVIEDNLEVRENLVELLELSDYEVDSAENGRLGVKKALDFLPNLIICDVMMPEMDGFGVLKVLNKNAKLNHIPFIFLTAKAEKTDFRKGMGLGADDYLTKPYDDVELLEAVELRLKKSEKLASDFTSSEDGLQHFFSEAKAQKELENLSLDRELRSYNTKDEIYGEGQKARWLYYIIEGEVKLFQTNEYGKVLTTQLLKAGEFFGYFPLLTGEKYSSSAACVTDTSLRLIPEEDFKILLFNNKDFAAKFIEMIANKTIQTEQKLIDMAYSSVRKKVANALVSFANLGAKETSGNSLNITVSREDLATTAGTAKETLIRTLSDFKAEGLIQLQSNSIVIEDLEELKDLIA